MEKNLVLTPLVTEEEVADAHRFNEEEQPLIKQMILGAQSYLDNAGAFKPNNPLTKVAVIMIVGHWLENRDAMNYDYKHMKNVPYSLEAVIYQLQYVGGADETS